MVETTLGQVAVVVPTIRPESFKAWRKAWKPLLRTHGAYLVAVFDGETPEVRITRYPITRYPGHTSPLHTAESLLDHDSDLISRFTPACRNLGFAAIAKLLPDVEYILTFDDDTRPIGDPIGQHIDTLNRQVPISWFATCSKPMRGFPYGVRDEAPVMFSHGVWRGVPDQDAPHQLVNGTDVAVDFYQGPIPKGIYPPICGMNCAFRREALPYAYWAPTVDLPGAERFDDIWMGIYLVDAFARENWAIYSGAAVVQHDRESDPIKNLRQEAVGIGINEDLWKGYVGSGHFAFFQEYERKRQQWASRMKSLA